MRYPKDVLVWEYAPGRKLAEVIITMKNVAGALASCSEAIAAYDINLLSGFHSAPSSSSTGRWSFFADVTNSKLTIEDIARKLKELPHVENVEVFSSQEGFLVDDKHCSVRWAGRKIVMLRTQAVGEMISRLWAVFGTGAATIVDEMGEAVGRFAANEVIADLGRDFVIKNLTSVLKIYTALGYGDIQILEYESEKPSLVLEARELFECEGNHRTEAERQNIFFRGNLKGFVSTLFHSELDVKELECVARGDAKCTFTISCVEKAVSMVPRKSDVAAHG